MQNNFIGNVEGDHNFLETNKTSDINVISGLSLSWTINGIAYKEYVNNFPTIIGRDSSHGIFISDGSISRKHAVITQKGGKYFIADLGSRNGIRKDSKVITGEYSIEHNCELVLGNVKLKFSIQNNIIQQ